MAFDLLEFRIKTVIYVDILTVCETSFDVRKSQFIIRKRICIWIDGIFVIEK